MCKALNDYELDSLQVYSGISNRACMGKTTHCLQLLNNASVETEMLHQITKDLQ